MFTTEEISVLKPFIERKIEKDRRILNRDIKILDNNSFDKLVGYIRENVKLLEQITSCNEI